MADHDLSGPWGQFVLGAPFSQHHQNTILIKCVILFNFWRCKTYEQLKLLLELIKYIKQTQTQIYSSESSFRPPCFRLLKNVNDVIEKLLAWLAVSPRAPWSCGPWGRCLTGLHYGPPMNTAKSRRPIVPWYAARRVSRCQPTATASCRRPTKQDAHVSQVRWRQTMKVIIANLKVIRWCTGSQWSWCSTGVIWSNFLVPVTTRAAAFWTVWSFVSRPSLIPYPYSRLLQ